MAPPPPDSVLFLAAVREEHLRAGPGLFERLVRDVLRQRGARCELYLLDLTRSGLGDVPGARVVRGPAPSLGELTNRALAETAAPFVAWCDPWVQVSPSRARLQLEVLERNPGARAVSSALVARAADGRTARYDVAQAASRPVPLWEAGMLWRREALAELEPFAFAPVLLRLLARVERVGGLVHAQGALGLVDAEAVESAALRAAQDALLVELARQQVESEQPLVSVLLATHQRRPVLLECLEAFARQLVPRGWHELVVVDDGSTDGTVELLRSLQLDVPLRIATQANAGPAAARNRGLELCTGELVLFANDDTIPQEDLVERHVSSHREHEDPVAILGTFEQPAEQLRTAGMRLLEREAYVFGYSGFEPGQKLHGEHFYTCNVSVSRRAVVAVGAFDEAFRHAMAEDTDLGLRLELAGVPVVYDPRARGQHRHVLRFEDLKRRQRLMGREHVRMWVRHPEVVAGNPQLLKVDRDSLLRSDRLSKAMLSDAHRACEALFDMDVAQLEEVGDEQRPLAGAAEGLLTTLFRRLHNLWWNEGLLEGLDEHDADSLHGLVERARERGVPEPAPRTSRELAHEAPEVSLIALVDGGTQPDHSRWLEQVAEAVGPNLAAEMVLVDGRRDPEFALDGAVVVVETSPSRGVRWRAGVAAASADVCVWLEPGAVPESGAVEESLAALRGRPIASVVVSPRFTCAVKDREPCSAAPWIGSAWRRDAAGAVSEVAFHPVEAQLLDEVRAEGRLIEREGKGVRLDSERATELARRWETDLELCRVHAEAHVGERPQLSVSIATYQRRETLLECLEAFCRQTLPPGAFEIVVVVDGSTDGTLEAIEGLQLPVPTRILSRPNGGLAAARNTGLEVHSGHYVLFVNDDTIPDPDCVQEHLRAHASSDASHALAVLGSFEQPPEQLDVALPRYLERSGEVFSFGVLQEGSTYDIDRFWTCNVSVPLELVREVGGYDESFRHYGFEDADLGARLAEHGLRVLYHPRARALHRHEITFDYLRARQAVTARACTHYLLKHPERIASFACEGVSRSWLRNTTEAEAAQAALVEALVGILSSLPVGSFQRLGGEFEQLAQAVQAAIREMVPAIDRHWWLKGHLAGLTERHLDGYAELHEHREPLQLETPLTRRVLAWPAWSVPESVADLVAALEPLAGTSFACLVLRHDPLRDPDKSACFQRFEAEYVRRYPNAPALDVLVEDRRMERGDLYSLALACDAWIDTGEEPDDVRGRMPCEPLRDAQAVAAWMRRFGEPPAGTAGGLRSESAA